MEKLIKQILGNNRNTIDAEGISIDTSSLNVEIDQQSDGALIHQIFEVKDIDENLRNDLYETLHLLQWFDIKMVFLIAKDKADKLKKEITEKDIKDYCIVTNYNIV